MKDDLLKKTTDSLRYWTALAFQERKHLNLREEYIAKAANLAMISLALREEQRDLCADVRTTPEKPGE